MTGRILKFGPLGIIVLALAQAGLLRAETNLTVAADGSAQFKTVQEAVNATLAPLRHNLLTRPNHPRLRSEI